MISSHFRQKFLNPVSLRLVQLFFDLFRGYPLYTREQSDTITPFFIIGSGRSGTTLLRSYLHNHEELDIPPETEGRIPNCVKKFYRYGGLDWNDLVNVIVGEFSSFSTFDFWDIDVATVRKRLQDIEDREKTLAVILNQLYLQHIREHKPSASRWGDKSPFNTLRLKWIDKVFPHAQYINIIRDGRAVVSSFLRSGLIEDLDKAADRWIRSVDNAEKFGNKLYNDQYITVFYEQLVQCPEKVIRKLCSFLDVDFYPSQLERKTDELGDQKMDHMKNVQRDVFTDSITKWEKDLENEQIKKLNERMASRLKKYGYSVEV